MSHLRKQWVEQVIVRQAKYFWVPLPIFLINESQTENMKLTLQRPSCEIKKKNSVQSLIREKKKIPHITLSQGGLTTQLGSMYTVFESRRIEIQTHLILR